MSEEYRAKWRILVTGEHGDLPEEAVSPAGGSDLEWIQLPVLDFERLPVEPEIIEALVKNPVEWIVFTSPRAVRFWSELLLENPVDWPLQTQVACLGERTAQAAEQDGFNPDFYPTEPGTEAFLSEFSELLSNNQNRPRMFIPGAENGRPLLREKLREMGCTVDWLPLYRTVPRDDVGDRLAPLMGDTDALLFTSPSSVEAVVSGGCVLPEKLKIISLGQFTASALKQHGIEDFKLLPNGDFDRIAEVL